MKAIGFHIVALSVAGAGVTQLDPALATIHSVNNTLDAALPICSQLKREYAHIPRATNPLKSWKAMPSITNNSISWRLIGSPVYLSSISAYLVADAAKRVRSKEDAEKVAAWKLEIPRDISSGRLKFLEAKTHIAGSNDTYHVIKEVFVGRDSHRKSKDDSWSYLFYRDNLDPANSESRFVMDDFAAFQYEGGILFVNPNETDIEGPVQLPAGDAVIRPQIGMQVYCGLAR